MKLGKHTSHRGAAADMMIVDAKGQPAQLISSENRDNDLQLLLQLQEGKQIIVPRTALTQRGDGTYQLPFATTDLIAQQGGTVEEKIIPVIEEQVHISKRVVDTGGVRVHKHVIEREEVIDEPLRRDELDVRHVPIGQIIDASNIPTARQEGDTFIVPVLEEVLVIHKQLRLKEEIHITRRQHEVHAPQTVTLKSERIDVQRFDDRNESS